MRSVLITNSHTDIHYSSVFGAPDPRPQGYINLVIPLTHLIAKK